MNDNARYAKIVTWSDEDQCFVGLVPGLITGGCHGPDERAVFDELCQIVDEAIAIHHEDGRPLPPATSGMEFAEIVEDHVARLHSQPR